MGGLWSLASALRRSRRILASTKRGGGSPGRWNAKKSQPRPEPLRRERALPRKHGARAPKRPAREAPREVLLSAIQRSRAVGNRHPNESGTAESFFRCNSKEPPYKVTGTHPAHFAFESPSPIRRGQANNHCQRLAKPLGSPEEAHLWLGFQRRQHAFGPGRGGHHRGNGLARE